MNWIKKIASTPLDAIARVINSWNSGDDKTKNAPSIQIVETALSSLDDDKVDKVMGMGLSANDFTDAYKTQVEASEYNTFGTEVDLDGYDWQNPYTFPCDGYLWWQALGYGATCEVYLIDAGHNNVMVSAPVEGVGGGGDSDFRFVRKGMKAFWGANPQNSNGLCKFFPLTSYTESN